MKKHPDRFSGHESFTFKYAWLTKVYEAVNSNPALFKDDVLATTTLGIGKNMVKSLQFWAEAAGIISSNNSAGYCSGPIGKLLLSEHGIDHYLESKASLWLIHWFITTRANLAAWNIVFGGSGLMRFDKPMLVDFLHKRSAAVDKNLAGSTIDQHASIFINSYHQETTSGDDTLWCPLQDLDLIKSIKDDSGRVRYYIESSSLNGITCDIFSIILVDYFYLNGSETIDFSAVLHGEFSPGVVLKLDEYQLRKMIEMTIDGPLKNSLKFLDTADTQSLTINYNLVDVRFKIERVD